MSASIVAMPPQIRGIRLILTSSADNINSSATNRSNCGIVTQRSYKLNKRSRNQTTAFLRVQVALEYQIYQGFAKATCRPWPFRRTSRSTAISRVRTLEKLTQKGLSKNIYPDKLIETDKLG